MGLHNIEQELSIMEVPDKEIPVPGGGNYIGLLDGIIEQKMKYSNDKLTLVYLEKTRNN